MSHFLIDQWDAVEIFCRVISKFDKKIKIKDFENNEFLRYQLNKYSIEENHSNVSCEVFGTKENKYNEKVSKRPRSFYELDRKIRFNIPVTLEEKELDRYLEYIGDKRFLIKNKKLLVEWAPSDKQRILEGSKWLLYYYHEDKVDNAKVPGKVSISGIARAVLDLNPFGKAIIEGYTDTEDYEGSYFMYGKEDKYIGLRMTLKRFKEKDLYIRFYIGTGKIRLALGQFHNLDKSIYSGTIMMEPITPENKKNSSPKFLKENEFGELPDYVMKYFKDKRLNSLRVPSKITSDTEFYEWYNRKNK